MATKNPYRNTFSEMIKLLRSFKENIYEQYPNENGFFYSQFNGRFIKDYYTLKKRLESFEMPFTFIKNLIKKLPRRVWTLRKYFWESISVIIILIYIYAFILVVPVFKGYLTVLISTVIIFWFVLRKVAENKVLNFSRSLNDLRKALEEELKEMKKYI